MEVLLSYVRFLVKTTFRHTNKKKRVIQLHNDISHPFVVRYCRNSRTAIWYITQSHREEDFAYFGVHKTIVPNDGN